MNSLSLDQPTTVAHLANSTLPHSSTPHSTSLPFHTLQHLAVTLPAPAPSIDTFIDDSTEQFIEASTPTQPNPLTPICDDKPEICDTNEPLDPTPDSIQPASHEQQTQILNQETPNQKKSISSQTNPPPSPTPVGWAELNPLSNSQSNSASIPDPHADRLALARRLLPAAGRQRRLRCDSFFSKLPTARMIALIAWLEEDSICDIQRRIAAPEPEGWGQNVDRNTLYRVKTLIEGLELSHRVNQTLDLSYEVLHAETTADSAPVREAVSQLLHSRLMLCAADQSGLPVIKDIIMALTRLEKLDHLRSSARTKTAPSPSPLHRVHLTLSATRTPPPQ